MCEHGDPVSVQGAGGHWRGHLIIERERRWLYADTGQPVADAPGRPCGFCGLPNTPEGHDGCLGALPGAVNACCGHGVEAEAYVVLTSGLRLTGSEAVRFFTRAPTGVLYLTRRG